MNAGKAAFEANCGKCHGLKKPSSRNEEQWRQVVPRMAKKVNKSEVKIDEATQEKIIRYLTKLVSNKLYPKNKYATPIAVSIPTASAINPQVRACLVFLIATEPK